MGSDEQIDISILKNDLLSTEDHVKTLTDQVDNLLANSDRYATDAQNIVSKAGGTSEGAQNTLEQGVELKKKIEEMRNEVENQIEQSSSQDVKDSIDDKQKEITNLANESHLRREKAKQSLEEANTAKMELTIIKDLVQQLKERKLAELVEVFAEDINSGDEDGLLKRLETAENKYQELKQKFDDFQDAQKDELNELLKRNTLDQQKLDKMVENKETLKNEVNKLEKIKETLPNWCRKS